MIYIHCGASYASIDSKASCDMLMINISTTLLHMHI